MTRRKVKPKWFICVLLFVLVAAFFFLYSMGRTTAPTQSEQLRTDLADGNLVVAFLDVGQGDSILVRQGSVSLLIDCGDTYAGENVADYLADQGLDRLDYMVLTHPHFDHIGGVSSVVAQAVPDTVYTPDCEEDSALYRDALDVLESNGADIRTAWPGYTFQVGQAKLEFLGPVTLSEDMNDCSLVLRLTFGDTAFLFMGDAQITEEQDILASGKELGADLLKVGHHGSATATSPDLLEAANARIAVISCGVNNTYGHPEAQTIEALKSAEMEIYRTDTQGTILAVSDGISIQMTTAR